VKSRFYYLFWGTATVAVVAGQVYVGAGYRMYSRSLNRLFNSIDAVVIPQPKPRGYYAPLVPPPPTGDENYIEWL
jgi:hypothetical protein